MPANNQPRWVYNCANFISALIVSCFAMMLPLWLALVVNIAILAYAVNILRSLKTEGDAGYAVGGTALTIGLATSGMMLMRFELIVIGVLLFLAAAVASAVCSKRAYGKK